MESQRQRPILDKAKLPHRADAHDYWDDDKGDGCQAPRRGEHEDEYQDGLGDGAHHDIDVEGDL